MRASMFFAFLFTVLWSSHVRAEDKYVGAIWTVKFKSAEKGTWVDCGLFRCTTDGKVYHNGKVIGSHKTINLNNVEMEITGAKDTARFAGTWKGTRVKKDGRVWEACTPERALARNSHWS